MVLETFSESTKQNCMLTEIDDDYSNDMKRLPRAQTKQNKTKSDVIRCNIFHIVF